MEFSKGELWEISDTIEFYMDSVSLWDFEKKEEYESKIEKLNDILAKIYKIVKE
jgi:hypothetical protein